MEKTPQLPFANISHEPLPSLHKKATGHLVDRDGTSSYLLVRSPTWLRRPASILPLRNLNRKFGKECV